MAIQEKKTPCRFEKDSQGGNITEKTDPDGQDAGQAGDEPERRETLSRLWEAVEEQDPTAGDILWETLVLFQNEPYYTAKGLEFTYLIKGNEMFVTRKDKSITKATVVMSFKKALELEGYVKGPKKLGTFGASYLYPVFQRIGVIKKI